jgi:hypothetical protein
MHSTQLRISSGHFINDQQCFHDIGPSLNMVGRLSLRLLGRKWVIPVGSLGFGLAYATARASRPEILGMRSTLVHHSFNNTITAF